MYVPVPRCTRLCRIPAPVRWGGCCQNAHSISLSGETLFPEGFRRCTEKRYRKWPYRQIWPVYSLPCINRSSIVIPSAKIAIYVRIAKLSSNCTACSPHSQSTNSGWIFPFSFSILTWLNCDETLLLPAGTQQKKTGTIGLVILC